MISSSGQVRVCIQKGLTLKKNRKNRDKQRPSMRVHYHIQCVVSAIMR